VLFYTRTEWNTTNVTCGIDLGNAYSVAFICVALTPGLKQPWARISERLRRYTGVTLAQYLGSRFKDECLRSWSICVCVVRSQNTRSVPYAVGALRGQCLTRSVPYAVSALRGRCLTRSVPYAVGALRGRCLTRSVNYAVSALRGRCLTRSVNYAVGVLRGRCITRSVHYAVGELRGR
jgi:hypothetical protein